MKHREAERRRELSVHVKRSWRHVEEMFDRRRNGVAANRRFGAALRFHVVLSGERRLECLSRLIRAERALGRQR